VRHPIYTGLLVASIGTAVGLIWRWLIAVALAGAYFIYGAIVEERKLTQQLPDNYPAYKRSTKMLVPFCSDLPTPGARSMPGVDACHCRLTNRSARRPQAGLSVPIDGSRGGKGDDGALPRVPVQGCLRAYDLSLPSSAQKYPRDRQDADSCRAGGDQRGGI
jgi:hypothetical protein